MFWKTRWENSIDGSNTPHRTLVSYKETHSGAKIDPSPAWTGTWRDPRFSPPSDGGRPENALTGTIFTVNCCQFDAVEVPAADGKLRFWRNTGVANLPAGQIATLAQGSVGYEFDEDLDNGSRPAGLFRLSTTTLNVGSHLQDYGSTYGTGQATHSLVLHRHGSGALVFGAGTVQYAWALDENHDNPLGAANSTSVELQQATVNVLADMGVQPGTLRPGLVIAAASTDQAPPASTITAPANGTTVQTGQSTMVTGTATDPAGVVGGVEVSVDGGATWRRANGRESWNYSWTPATIGTATIRSRAVDDSGNLQSAGPTVTVNVEPRTCPCSIWSPADTPAIAADSDGQAVELGVKFRTDIDGYISGVRFYKGPGNTGTHVGSLWAANGTKLAGATFAGESASGWQQVLFSTPVQVTANTTYVASYHAPNGHFSVTSGQLASADVGSAPLRALKSGADGPNGVYRHGTSGFPTDSYNASNYWVDVVFATTATDTVPPTVIQQVPAPNTTRASTTANVAATFSEPVNPASIAFTLRDAGNATVPAAVTYDAATRTTTLDPNAPLAESVAYTATLSGATDAAGNAMAPVTWSFTTAGPATSIWDGTETPAVASSDDGQAVEVGVKFRSDVAGYVSGVRFYKGPGNIGTHVGSLWAANGTKLAGATFVNETASGWQQALFSTPVQVTANTTYVVSYHAPNGRYAVTPAQFATTGVASAPLQALATGVDGPNGLYRYGSSGFPTDSHNASNYWVDVVFATTATDTVPPSLIQRVPAPNVTNASPVANVAATFSEPVNPASIAFSLRDAGNATVPAAVTYDAATRIATLDPNAPLAQGETFTATVSGAADPAGNVMVPATWSFATASCPCSIWAPADTPAVAADSDGQAVEVGVKFRSDVAGYVSGVRFYKGPGNTGTHVGSLWAANGTKLAGATFAGESTSGWQQVLFSTPVQVTANTTYVVSYHAPNGHFSVTQGQFATAEVVGGPLRALKDGADGPNGVYRYGSSGFPTDSYQASNYWVDVVFGISAADTVPPTVTSATPPNGATRAPLGANLTATFSEPVAPASISFILRNAGGATVPAVTGYDADTRTATLDPNAPLVEGETLTATVSGAADPAGNAMAPATWSFTTAACPCSVWDPTATPVVASDSDAQPIEVGVKFRSDVAGYVSGVRFYKGPGNTGTHVGSLWAANGTKLTSATFSNETASGWQQALFPTPVQVQANTTYVVSYHAPNGHFSVTQGQFAAAEVIGGPLRALKDGADGPNGVYRYGSSGFPTDSYQASNYWVDVVFATTTTDTAPPTVTQQVPVPNATRVSPASNLTATFGEPVSPASISFVLRNAGGATVPAATSYDAATRTATLDPNAPLAEGETFTATVSGAADPAGNAMAPATWSFITAACPCSIWDSTATPAVAADGDTQAVELGVKIRPDTNGYITGIRFYKGPGNTGTHVGSVWAANGTKLASATFSNETATGWQQAQLPVAVQVTANTTYVVSYHAPTGHFSTTPAQFATADVVGGPLRALRSGADGPNGVYRYGPSSFPTDSYNATNYWVDVVFTTVAPPPDTIAPTISAVQASGVTTSGATIGWTTNEAADSQVEYGPTTSYGSASTLATALITGHSVSLSGLQSATTYHYRVKSRDPAGNLATSADFTLTTGTPTPPTCPCSIWGSTATPAIAASNDGQAVEVGVKLRSDVPGYVTGIRFYKGAGNTGTHVGSLWAANGTKLSSATFTNETASGWQQALLPAPVQVTANTTYVVSYHAPNGHYAVTPDQFAMSEVVGAPLRALRSGADGPNGVYRYGPSSFPTDSYQASNYWVDVVFTTTAPPPDTTPPTVTGVTPANGATGVAVTANATAAFSEPMSQASLTTTTVTLVRQGSQTPVAAAVTYDAATLTVTLDPAASLEANAPYTATVKSGSNGARDVAGNGLAADRIWTFTTAP